jgi:lambda family phage tail tape measure protein
VGGLVIARTASAAFSGLNATLMTSGTIAGLKAVSEISTGLAVRLAVLQGATSLATVAMRGFGAALAFVGGPVGLAVLAGVALYKMASGHDAAGKAARDHADELAELKAAAHEAADGVEALNEATANEAFFRYEEQLRTAKENIVALKKELTLGAVGGFWDQLRRTGTPLQADLVALRRELLSGRISAEEYSDAIFALARKYPSFGEQAQDIREQVLALQAAELAAKNATAALDALNNPQKPEETSGNKPKPKPTGTSSDQDAAKDYARAQQRIKEQIAALTAQEQALHRLTAAREDGADAVAAALLLNEQENTLRQLGLSLTESEGTAKAKQASQIKELVASIQALKQTEADYQDKQKAAEKLARERAQAVEDVRKRYDQLDTTLAGAIERAKSWRTEAMAGLDETAHGYAEFRQQVDAVFNQMLKDAWDEDLRNSKRWRDGVTRALQDVSEAASDRAAQMEQLVSNAFRGMEDALVDFVQTGKLDFKSLADSIIADLIRMQIQATITAPLTAALNAGIGSIFGAPGSAAASSTAAPVAHTGGVIGSDALPSRMVSAAVFASAPRFHGGGVVGSEVPIIAQRGEAVLTPGQMAMLGGAIKENQAPSITVHIHNNTGTQTEARTEVNRKPNGDLSLKVILEQMQGDMARNISRGEGLAPTLERRYGLNPAAGSFR